MNRLDDGMAGLDDLLRVCQILADRHVEVLSGAREDVVLGLVDCDVLDPGRESQSHERKKTSGLREEVEGEQEESDHGSIVVGVDQPFENDERIEGEEKLKS